VSSTGNARPGVFGEGCQGESDVRRLCTQMERVRDHMLQAAAHGRWLTLSEIRAALEATWRCRFPEASVSAQLRHLKKPVFGAYRLEKRRRHGPGYGLFEYRLLSPEPLRSTQQELFAGAHA
jgi:hypothetical protein